MKYIILFLFSFLLLFIGCHEPEQIRISGILERKIIEVSAPVSEVIIDIPVKTGEQVQKGDLIVQLDTEVAVAELKAHEAALSAAKALLKESTGEYRRQEKLRRMNVSSTQSFDRASRKRDEAIAKVAEKKARIAQAMKGLNDLSIRSRVSGKIDQLPYESGERTPAGGVVAVIISNDAPWVRIWLPSAAVARLNVGQDARVHISGIDTVYSGYIEYISREPEYTPHYALTERESAYLVYETRVRIKAIQKEVSPGLTAWVEIPIDK